MVISFIPTVCLHTQAILLQWFVGKCGVQARLSLGSVPVSLRSTDMLRHFQNPQVRNGPEIRRFVGQVPEIGQASRMGQVDV